MPTFLVVAHERSGSSWLCDSLAPACLGEIWGPALSHYRGSDPRLQPIRYFREWLALHRARGAKLLMHGQLPRVAAEAMVQEVDRVILLGRLNLTEAAVSMWFARRFNDWQAHCKRVVPEKIAPQPAKLDELRKWLRRMVSDRREWNEILTAARVPVLRLWYEGLDAATIGAARAFLEIPGTASSDRMKQRDQSEYMRMLSNYDEINDAFGKRYGLLFGQPGDWWRTDYPPAL